MPLAKVRPEYADPTDEVLQTFDDLAPVVLLPPGHVLYIPPTEYLYNEESYPLNHLKLDRLGQPCIFNAGIIATDHGGSIYSGLELLIDLGAGNALDAAKNMISFFWQPFTNIRAVFAPATVTKTVDDAPIQFGGSDTGWFPFDNMSIIPTDKNFWKTSPCIYLKNKLLNSAGQPFNPSFPNVRYIWLKMWNTGNYPAVNGDGQPIFPIGRLWISPLQYFGWGLQWPWKTNTTFKNAQSETEQGQMFTLQRNFIRTFTSSFDGCTERTQGPIQDLFFSAGGSALPWPLILDEEMPDQTPTPNPFCRFGRFDKDFTPDLQVLNQFDGNSGNVIANYIMPFSMREEPIGKIDFTPSLT